MWCIIGYETGVLWNLWDWFISPSTHTAIWWRRVAPWPLYIPHSNPHTWQTMSGLHSTTSSFWIRVDSQTIPRSSETINQHYNDVIMGAIASQITSLTIVYSIVYSDADQRKHQSSASLAFVRGIHRGPVNSPHKWPITRKMFPFDDVIMIWQHSISLSCTHIFWHSWISKQTTLSGPMMTQFCDVYMRRHASEKFCILVQILLKFVLRFQLTASGSGNDLAPNRRQAVTSWTDTDTDHWRIYAALRGDELKYA